MAMYSIIPNPARDPFAAVHQEMIRLFEPFGGLSDGSSKGGISPRIDVSETEAEIDIEAELPGVDEKDLDVTLAGDLLTIRGERKNEHEEKRKNYHLSERSHGSFVRSVALPFDAEPGTVTARFDNGVLRIAIPKPADIAARTTKIPVKAV